MSRAKDLIGAGFSAGQCQAVASGGAAVVATGTGSIANAKLLPFETNNLSAGASLDAYLLPSTAQGSSIGDEINCFGGTSTTAVVFAGTGETINGSASFNVAQNKFALFKRVSSTVWGAFVTA